MYKRSDPDQRALFRDDRITSKDYLESCRSLARTLVRRYGEATTDDIRRMAPTPDWINPSVLGHVFKRKEFKQLGLRKRKMNKGGGGFVIRWGEKNG